MEKYDCGCSTTFGKTGEVRAVTVCDKHDAAVFSEHKSLKQMALDMHHQQFKDKYQAKEEAKVEAHAPAPAEAPKAEEAPATAEAAK